MHRLPAFVLPIADLCSSNQHKSIMKHTFDPTLRLADLTIGQFLQIVNDHNAIPQPSAIDPTRRYIYGMEAIAEEFGVSTRTLAKYKKTWLAPAIHQNGRNVQCDAELGHKLFARHAEEEARKKAAQSLIQ